MQILLIIIILKSFKYEAKLLGNTEADGNNGILKNTAVYCASKIFKKLNFLRSLKMSLSNCKIELKLKWTKYFVLSAAGADNNNANSNNIIFTIKGNIIYSCSNISRKS